MYTIAKSVSVSVKLRKKNLLLLLLLLPLFQFLNYVQHEHSCLDGLVHVTVELCVCLCNRPFMYMFVMKSV